MALLDVQWQTDHLATLGVVEVPRPRYLELLDRAVASAAALDTGAADHRSPQVWSPGLAAPVWRAPSPGWETDEMADKPWLMRTYSGHSTARASNELYRTNLAKGQTGLSIAFDLPTQTGYDPDHPLARGEVGKVGVPVAHLGHMRTLLDGIPPGEMNTSMTINAPAAWLLGLYVANAEDQGVATSELRGTTQNDIVKEYLSRGHLHLPARAEPPAHRRHGRLVRRTTRRCGTP